MTTEVESPPILWARRNYVLRRFSLPFRQLETLVKRRVVRAVKLGRHQQSRLLFHVGDVESALKEQAERQGPQIRESGGGKGTLDDSQ